MSEKMRLRDDLVATKALIDTPEKWEATGRDILTACGRATNAGRSTHLRLLETHDALAEQTPGHFRRSANNYGRHHTTTHADVMALLDRAIAAALVSEPSQS